MRFNQPFPRLTFVAVLTTLVVSALHAAPPPPPAGFDWMPNPTYTDEFNGDTLDLTKWYDYHPRWVGRPPAKFMPYTVAVTNGFMQIRNDVLNPPQGSYTIAGGAVVSCNTTALYGYYEVRMKASKLSMSSTFWMANPNATAGGVTSSHEIDIQETIGAPYPTPTWAANWDKRMNFNTHYFHRNPDPDVDYSQGGNHVFSPPNPASDDDFHIYGAWWVDANTVKFYYNNQLVGTVKVPTNVVAAPFDRPMHVNLVTETYDWMAPPSAADLTNNAINTTYYDWVRAYTLQSTNAPPPTSTILWQDAQPQSSASDLHGGITMVGGNADPAGGTGLVSRCFYPDPTHTEYQNLGVSGNNSGYTNAGLATSVQAPLGGGYMYANVDSNHLNRPFLFKADVYLPTASALGADANDSVGLVLRWQDGGGANVKETTASANMALRNTWQQLLLWGNSPTNANATRVAPLLATRDNGVNASQNSTLYFLRNVEFRLLNSSPAAPTLRFTRQDGDLVLDWSTPGFKLQSQTTLANSGLGTNWVDHPLPDGVHPPVTVAIMPTSPAVFYRLAPW